MSAARFRDVGIPLVKLLLRFGVNADYNNYNDTMGGLALMLGIGKTGKSHRTPSTATLSKELKASWKLSVHPRYQVIDWMFAVEQPVSQDDINTTLNKAVSNEPDLRLIKLLLGKGASPLANGCQSLIDAAQTLLVDIVEAFLETNIPPANLSWAFTHAHNPMAVDRGLSKEGCPIAGHLLPT